MGRTFVAGLMFVGAVGLSGAPALAHHTVANAVDVGKLVSLTGTVTAVEWKYPHVVYHLAVSDPNGAAIDWEIESRHPQGMHHDGIEQDTIRAGDRVTMNVMLARDGSHQAATASIVLADGRMLRVCTVTNAACPS
jgi:uncharacterized protein DUF6152